MSDQDERNTIRARMPLSNSEVENLKPVAKLNLGGRTFSKLEKDKINYEKAFNKLICVTVLAVFFVIC